MPYRRYMNRLPNIFWQSTLGCDNRIPAGHLLTYSVTLFFITAWNNDTLKCITNPLHDKVPSCHSHQPVNNHSKWQRQNYAKSGALCWVTDMSCFIYKGQLFIRCIKCKVQRLLSRTKCTCLSSLFPTHKLKENFCLKDVKKHHL